MLKVSELHRVREFEQEKWMEPYIKLNTDLRA